MIFEQISIIYQLPRLFVGSFTLVLPYFPTGTGARLRCLRCLPACLPACVSCVSCLAVACCCSLPGILPRHGSVQAAQCKQASMPTLPCRALPVSAAERVEAEGDVATAFTLARIISNIPLARGGPGVQGCVQGCAGCRPPCAGGWGKEGWKSTRCARVADHPLCQWHMLP